MNADFAYEAGALLLAEMPVDLALAVGIGRGLAPALLLVPLRAGEEVFAKCTGADELEEEMPLGIRAKLKPGLKDRSRRGLRGGGDGTRVLDRNRRVCPPRAPQ
jgi:hypothetical protein